MNIDENNIDNAKYVIYGVTNKNEKFRPSDWTERLASIIGTFDEKKKLCYSQYVQPMIKNGVAYVLVKNGIDLCDEKISDFILDFAKQNDLKIITENLEIYL